MSQPFDPKRTPARADLAADFLHGKVPAKKFVTGTSYQVNSLVADLVFCPTPNQTLETQLLFGEPFIGYENKNGWIWGQATRDGFVGYVGASHLVLAGPKPDHWVSALRTPIYSYPDLKAPIDGYLHRNSQVCVTGYDDHYRNIGLGWVHDGDLQPQAKPADDWVEIAQSYLHTPYLWGGRSSFGLDCSALVQNALHATGIACPRDSYMQQADLGKTLQLDDLRRGDLIFWKGHVGLMLSEDQFLHANAHHMATAIEPVQTAIDRLINTAGPVIAVQRL